MKIRSIHFEANGHGGYELSVEIVFVAPEFEGP